MYAKCIVHDKYLVDYVSALNFRAFFAYYIIMPSINCDNGWPAFDGCMPFWQPSCVINCLIKILWTQVFPGMNGNRKHGIFIATG